MIVTIAVGLVALLAILIVVPSMLFCSRRYSFSGKRVFLTGASQGLGRATAVELAKKGAHIVLMARNETELKAAVAEAIAVRKSEDQKIEYVVCDVTKKDQVAESLSAAVEKIGAPDVLIPCAGSSIPKLFLDASLEDIEAQMQLNYFGTVYFVHEGVKIMRDQKIKGKVVFVSSTLALTTVAGYGPYTPTKWAIRGLADTLESELRLYDITVHHIYPPGMETPGFKQENLTKPAMTKEIEGAAEVFTPQSVAVKLVKGVESGKYHITCDIITYLLRVISGGTSPRQNLFWEMMILPLLSLIMAIVAWSANNVVDREKRKMN